MSDAPKVFISHASEDKDRFVVAFAERLRANGVDAWLDKWEILPGDSLVDRIFEEGIKDAQVMIIVLSKNSIDKPWVREELNAGIVNRINEKSKLIPIVIDSCENDIPQSLQNTVWQSIESIDDYEEEFKVILKSIFDFREKPDLGEPPRYASGITVGGLNEFDSTVLVHVYDQFVNKGKYVLNFVDLHNAIGASVTSVEDLSDSLVMLKDRLLLKATQFGGVPHLDSIMPTASGFGIYASSTIEGFESNIISILHRVHNQKLSTSMELSETLELDHNYIVFTLDYMDLLGLVKFPKTVGEATWGIKLTVQGKRLANES